MTQGWKALLLSTLVFLTLFGLVDAKNYVVNGVPFVVTGDVLDRVKEVLTYPGDILAFYVVLLVSGDIHHYDWHLTEAIALVSSALLYGCITALVLRRVRMRRIVESQESRGGPTSG